MSQQLAAALEGRRAGGRKLLVAYLMAGSTPTWLETAEALVAAGADALEVGLPFSDPIIDGPVIQDAATRSLAVGTSLSSVVAELSRRDLGVPLIAMTYLNVVLAAGYERSAGRLAGAGVTGAILPDLPLEELDAWQGPAEAAGIETVLLAAPSTPPGRLDAAVRAHRGLLLRGGADGDDGGDGPPRPTGHRACPLAACPHVAAGLPRHRACRRRRMPQPPAQEAEGVVVGTAIVRRMLEGAAPDEVGAFVATLRAAIDEPTGR